MQKIILIIAALVCTTSFCRSAEVTSQDIDSALDKNSLTHPYLYFDAIERDTIKERAKTDPVSKSIMDKLLAEGNRILNIQVEHDIPREKKHPRYDWDNPFLEYYTSYSLYASKLAFLYQMTGEVKYAEKSFEISEALCDLDTWVIRACMFPIFYGRVMPRFVQDGPVNFNMEIYSAFYAGINLALVYDWLYDWFSVRQRDRIRGALIEKVITPVRGDWEYHWWATAYRCNWIYTAGIIGTVSLSLLKEDPRLTDMVAEGWNRCYKAFDEIDRDGGWQEGTNYSVGSQECLMNFGEPLRRLTNGKYDLYTHPRMKSNPVSFKLFCYLPPDRTVNFCDATYEINDKRFSHTFNRMADIYNSDETSWYVKNVAGQNEEFFDLIFPPTKVVPKLPEQTSCHFRDIDWVVMRSDFTSTDKFVIACKAGLNDDPHHGHLDCGQFILFWQGESFVKDLGHGSYDEQYFDEVRWNYPQASSAGHNVVFVNGELQIPGKRRGQPFDETVGGKILDFRTDDVRDYTLMDCGNAYPKKEMKSWRRHIVLEKPNVAIVLDEIVSAPGSEIEARFFSECEQNNMGEFVFLRGKHGNMVQVPVSTAKVIVRPGELADMPVTKDAVLTMIPFTGTVVKAKGEKTLIANVFVPAGDEKDAASFVKTVSIKSNGNGTIIKFKRNGSEKSFIFRDKGNGLVLE